jgi:hypothetical protein
VQARIVPANPLVPQARFVRIELPGKERILSLAEVQVFQGDKNVAQSGEARQSTTAFDGPARLAIDGNTNGDLNFVIASNGANLFLGNVQVSNTVPAGFYAMYYDPATGQVIYYQP